MATGRRTRWPGAPGFSLTEGGRAANMKIEQTTELARADILPAGSDDVYDDGRLRIEHGNYYASISGRRLRLTRKEFLLLSRLARNTERVVLAEDLWRHAWGEGVKFNAESLHVHVYRLRRLISPNGFQIEAMVRVGYRLTTCPEPHTGG